MMLTTQAQIAAMEGTVGQAAHMAFPGASGAAASPGPGSRPGVGHVPGEHPGVRLGGADDPGGDPAAALRAATSGSRRSRRSWWRRSPLFTVASVVILQWTNFRIRLPDLGRGLPVPVPASGGGAGVLGVRDHGRRGVRAGRLSLLVHREGIRPVRRPASARRGLGRRARGWLAVMQLDAWFSMVVFTVATVAFYLLGAAVLHPQGLDPKGPEMIPTLSQMYLQPLGSPGPAWSSCSGPGPSCSRRSTSPRPRNSRLTADFLTWPASGIPRSAQRGTTG